MKFVIVLSAVMAFASGYSYAGLGQVSPWVQSGLVPQTKYLQTYTPAVESTQYSHNFGFGSVAYGYQQPDRVQTAFQDGAGNKVGRYSYVKPGGSVSRTDYVSDSLGYRVDSNYLPVRPVIATPGLELMRTATLSQQSPFAQTVYTSVYNPLANLHPEVVISKRSTTGMTASPQKPDTDRYPQLNPNPQTNLYTNAKPGQEYASSSHYVKN